jgi:transposase
LYQQTIELHKQGLSGRAIARTLGLHRVMISRFLENEVYPARIGKFPQTDTLMKIKLVSSR